MSTVRFNAQRQLIPLRKRPTKSKGLLSGDICTTKVFRTMLLKHGCTVFVWTFNNLKLLGLSYKMYDTGKRMLNLNIRLSILNADRVNCDLQHIQMTNLSKGIKWKNTQGTWGFQHWNAAWPLANYPMLCERKVQWNRYTSRNSW